MSTNNKKITKIYLILVMAFTFVIALLSLSPALNAASLSMEDSDVENSASFSTDTIYQIVTDRFFDGDPSNNPTGDIFDKSNNRKYHGGDWAGITQKINDGYLTNMGISAIWISSPVENITTIDPSNNSAAYHGYWAKDFYRTNSFFGSVQDFKTMIDTAHDADI